MTFQLVCIEPKELTQYKSDMQEAFQKGFEDVFGKTDAVILPEKDIDQSLNAEGSAVYKAVVDGEMVGGAVVIINESTQHNHLDLLFVKNGVQSNGIGKKIWFELERIYPNTKVYSYAGRTRGLKDLAGIYDFYAGNVFGKLFQVFAWLFNACCYMFMISGFGNVFHQQWGISIPIGSAIGVVLSVTIAVMGLNKIIDIIGKVGPIIVLFTLFIGIVAAFKYYPMIVEGNAAINSGDVDVIHAGSNWVTAGLSFGGCNLLLVSAFVGTIGYNLREYKFIYNQLIMIISSGGIMLVSFLMGLNHIGNIQAAVQASIPNLLLANSVFGGNAGIILSLLFAIIILAAIFSTICPMLWTCASMLAKDDKSKKYKLICVIAGICVYIITLFVPYETLLNYIMTYCGYSGCVVAVVCIVRYFIIKSRDKKEGLFKESV